MRRLAALFVVALIAGAASPALAQSASPDPSSSPATQVQYRQQPYGQPAPYGEERRGRRGDAIRIIDAWYGYGHQACNAARPIARACDGRSSCTIQATNRLCGDPAQNIVKVLTVNYRCHGRVRSITRGEGRYLGLRCD